jgi:hypothetical protein
MQFFDEKQKVMCDKINNILAPYLKTWKIWRKKQTEDKNDDEGIYSEDEYKVLMSEMRAFVRYFLPDLVAVCEENPVMITFLKEEVVLIHEFWDIELTELHGTKNMPKIMSQKSPMRGFHSLDVIFGYYYAYAALAEGVTPEHREKNMKKACEFDSFYGLLYSIRNLSDQISLKQDSIDLKLLNQINTVNLLYGTPGYTSSAYFLFCLANVRPKIAKDCLYLAKLYTHVAEKIMPHCKTAINNLDPFDKENDPELFFSGHDEIFALCKNLTQSDRQDTDAVYAQQQADKEVKVFLKQGLYDLPTQKNVLQFPI